MPGKKRVMWYKRKARKSKPRFRRRKQVLVNRALQPVAQRYICKMKYCETITTSGTGSYSFNLNSIFDPNRTGVGHQPYGHDTLETLYNRYRVISCGYRIQAVQSYNSIPIQIAVQPANELLSFTTISEMKENPRSKYVTVSPGAPAVILKGKSYIPSLVGRNKAQYMAEANYQAQFGSSPSELAILNVKTQTLADVDTSFTMNVLLEYTVEVFDIKHLAQS